jgi:hypothetical protein
MSQATRTIFTSLSRAEKQSKLWQLSQSGLICTLWTKGSKHKIPFKVHSYSREDDTLAVFAEDSSLTASQEILGTFDLKGVSFFFKGKIEKTHEDKVLLSFVGDFYKSERRSNFRLMAYPIYSIYCLFDLPKGYEGGGVIDFKSKMSQTGLFKSFLKLVDTDPQSQDLRKLKLRVQDISVTGLSLSVGEDELEWIKAGELLNPLTIQFSDMELEVKGPRVVYVVDYLGHAERGLKKFKVGIKFEGVDEVFDRTLSQKINSLLREIDANSDFEDFLK